MNSLIIDFKKNFVTVKFYKSIYKFFSNHSNEKLISIYKPEASIENIPDLRHFLVDNYSRMHNYLRISLTERCNLRCQV